MNPIVLRLFKKYSRIDREPCRFESTGWRRKTDRAEVVVCTRRGCRRHAFTKWGPERTHAHCLHPRFGLGNLVRDSIKLVTLGIVKPKAGCNCEARRRLLNVVFGFNLPDWLVAILEIVGRHQTQALPWDNPKVREWIEIGEPDRREPPKKQAESSMVG